MKANEAKQMADATLTDKKELEKIYSEIRSRAAQGRYSYYCVPSFKDEELIRRIILNLQNDGYKVTIKKYFIDSFDLEISWS